MKTAHGGQIPSECDSFRDFFKIQISHPGRAQKKKFDTAPSRGLISSLTSASTARF